MSAWQYLLQAHTLKPASAGNSDGHQEVRGDRIVFTQVRKSSRDSRLLMGC